MRAPTRPRHRHRPVPTDRLKRVGTIAGPLAVTLLLALAPGTVSAQDVAGRWVLSVELDAGSGDATFVFEVEDGRITGTYSGTLGEHSVHGTIEGADITFSFEMDQVGTVSYEGTIDGDTMRGSCEYGMLGSGTFSGTRQAP